MRGEIWLADLNPSRGSEQAGIRPVVVIQRASLDRFTTTVVVVPLTTNLRRLKVPGGVLIPAGEGGLDLDSVALCFQLSVIDRQRLIRALGQLTATRLAEINRALKYTLDLE
ncbi:MAG: type II toxin-antitoxin system PemK/MazF family toxin [Chloroflexota bacterium]|nr:type II toxin-antitoxin system PemK/MazF family toxin [Chloroflexota bacterium]